MDDEAHWQLDQEVSSKDELLIRALLVSIPKMVGPALGDALWRIDWLHIYQPDTSASRMWRFPQTRHLHV